MTATGSRSFAAALSALLLALPASAQDPVFGGEELKKAWADKELMGLNRAGTKFYIAFKGDGTATFTNANTNAGDTGVWRATDAGYCAKWQRLREGKEGCFTVRRSGGVFIVYDEAGTETARIHNVR